MERQAECNCGQLRAICTDEPTEEQSLAIQRDYAMKDGRREIDVHLSMAYYFITRMNLDLPDLPPARAQICLSNIDEVRKAIEDAKSGSKARILERKGRSDGPGAG